MPGSSASSSRARCTSFSRQRSGGPWWRRQPPDILRGMTLKEERPVVARPADAPVDYSRDLGDPGAPPYTRGIYPTMYRGRRWTMRQYAGFGSARQTNERFRALLAAGQTGLSVAFDLPTQMGYDSDHARAAGEVGRVGVAIS